ncbi:MobF family relaxase, partial [Massilia sp. TSP1-1-2]|uniref:MobF family relaxase n=1 Tax=Massilia sp. TSP1-1-2 TaxID=2804649 RepID=UPI003CE846A8
MLNVTPIRGNDHHAAAHYFSAADDYYAKENPGEWQGIGAESLGLKGAVEQVQLARLLDGQLPNGERIQKTFDRSSKKKRMGLDLTFSAPKSVSMQALVASDRTVTLMHDRAVTRALEQVERLAEARKKVKGKSYRERTGNLVIAKFRHEMSRAKDPQLHTHSVVFNMTQRSDGAWRALSNEDIFLVRTEIEAIYRTELAMGLKALGYGIRLVDDKGGFELAHISRDQIEAFSSRSQVIEAMLADEGKTRASASRLEKQIIAIATRPRKDEGDRAIVKQYWVEKSRELGIDYGENSKLNQFSYTSRKSGGSGAQDVEGEGSEPARDRAPSVDGTARNIAEDRPSVPLASRDAERSGSTSKNQAAKSGLADSEVAGAGGQNSSAQATLKPVQIFVQYAIDHLTEREATVRESALSAAALQRAVGLAGLSEVRTEIKRLVNQGTLIESMPAYRIADRKDGLSLSAAGWQNYLGEMKGWSANEARQYVANAIKQGSLVPNEKRYTTQKALKCEKSILAIGCCRSSCCGLGRGRCCCGIGRARERA